MYQPPPPLPTNYIPRPQLLQTATDAIFSSKCDSKVCTTLTLLGMGGFGKTTMAKALCHQPTIKRHFLDGFLWITLGQHPPNTEMKLNQLYDQLNLNKFKGNFSTKDILYCHVTNNIKRLLVVIDDVWDANDAKIYAEIFSSCKIVLTTRKNNIASHISTKKIFKVEEMNIDEAIELLTINITVNQSLSSCDKQILEGLATDLHRWPILLSLVRNQLHEHLQMQSSFGRALHKVKQTLYSKGLTAFDDPRASKENAVKASVDATLDLLTNSEIFNIKTIVLYAGFGVYIPKALLHQLWDGGVEHNIQRLWSCGLITLTKLVLTPSKVQLPCVEIHAVIALYLVDKMDYGTLKEILNLSVSNVKSISWSLNTPEEDYLEFESEDDIPDDSENPDNALFYTRLNLGFMDNLGLPLVIQKLVVVTKIVQQNIAEQIKLLSEQFCHSHAHLYSLLSQFEESNTLKSAVGDAYMHFVKFHKEIKPLLTFDSSNYSCIVSQLKTFLKQHPIRKIEFEYYKFLQNLVQQCNEDAVAMEFIVQNTSYKDKQDIGVQSMLPILERLIRLRYKFVSVLNSNCIFVTYLEAIMDMSFDNNQCIVDTIGGMSPDILTAMQSIDTEDNEVKPVYDALEKMLSDKFNQDPQSKPFIANYFNVNQFLPTREFAIAMIRSYFQSIPRAY